MDEKKKEQARREILQIMRNTLESTHGYITQFEGFFEDHLAENNFAQAADDKITLDKLIAFRDSMEECISNPTDANIERFIDDSAAYARFCEGMAEGL